jgi:hypothetical protein
VTDLIGPRASDETPIPARIAFTSGRPPSAALEVALKRFRIGA